MNLIDDAWIPACTVDGARRLRAWEVADADVEWVDRGRGDLDLGCLELPIGLVLIADPPENEADWHARYERPLGERLRERLEALSPHFELDGPGPRFMQDLEPFETDPRMKASPADMLFIDSPGARTRRNNADISVTRDRYGDLPLDLAAMALYALQAWAPSGGAGNRTALRRGRARGGARPEEARSAVPGLVEALATGSPKGRRTSYGHHPRAGYIRAEAGNTQPRSLASAFLRPITGDDLLGDSAVALTQMAERLDAAYGPNSSQARG